MTEGERALRIDLAAAYRLVHWYGWSDLLGTHLSAREAGTDGRFLINPYGFLFDEITASLLVMVEADGTIVDGGDNPINPAAVTIHGAAYQARRDIGCVMHTHTEAGVSVATQKDGLLPLTQHALAVIAHTAYHDYEGIATDPGEQARLARDLGDNKVMILRNHGLLTVGETVAEAFVWMYRAERACRMQLAFQQSGAAPAEIPPAVIETTIARNRLANSEEGHRPIGRTEWPALIRMLDRVDSSYKN